MAKKKDTKSTKTKDKNKIKCNVDSCDYNDDKCCCLNSVEINCTCDGDDCTCCDDTICQSFKSTGGIITDTEYEVTSELIADELVID